MRRNGPLKGGPYVLLFALTLSSAIGAQRGGPAGVREVTVTGIPGVVAAGATWTLAWQGTDNADGIVGADDGGLLFAQEQPNRISKLDRNDHGSVFIENTHGTGAIAIDAKARIAIKTIAKAWRTRVLLCG